MHPQITLCHQVVDQEPRRTERQGQTSGDLCDRGAVHARRQDLAPHIISRPARRLRCGVERFDRSLECQFDTRVGTACRQRVWPDQARLVRGFRFCEPVADRFALALRLLMRVGVLLPDMWRTMRHVLVLQEPQGLVGVHRCAHLAGDDLEYGAVGVDDECGPSDRQQPGQQATAPSVPATPGRLTRHDGSTQLGEPASAHPEQLGHHAVRVGEQRIVERALLGEVGLPVDGVGADAHPLGAHPGEFVAQVPKMTSLGCTDR